MAIMKVTDKKFLNVHQTIGPLTCSTTVAATNAGASANGSNKDAAAAAKAVLNAFGQVGSYVCMKEIL